VFVERDNRLDLKTLAKLTGDRKVETVPLKEIQPLTGYGKRSSGSA